MNRFLTLAASAIRWIDLLEYLAQFLMLLAQIAQKKQPSEPKEV